MTDYDKNMRAIQTLKAQLTGQQNMCGAEDIRQLQDLTETITPATRHTNRTTADLTSMQTELHNLRIATSDAMHRLKTDLGIEAPESHKSPTDAPPRVSPPRVQQPTTASAPRVPPPRVQQPTTASAPRAKTQTTTQPHDGPASRTRLRISPSCARRAQLQRHPRRGRPRIPTSRIKEGYGRRFCLC